MNNVKEIRAGHANASQSLVWDGAQGVQSGCEFVLSLPSIINYTDLLCRTRRQLMNIKLESRNS